MVYFITPGTAYQVQKLVPKLKFRVRHLPLKFRQPEGPLGRLKLLRKTVTALFKHERIELNLARASEARGYAERLITDAIHYGDCHHPTMEMADFWLEEKQLIHKLFKVLAPRYKESTTAFTNIHQLPALMNGNPYKRAVLELSGNPFPPVVHQSISSYFQLHNVLLHEAKKEFHGECLLSDGEKSMSIDRSEVFADGSDGKHANMEERLVDEFKKLETESIPSKKNA